MVRGVRLLFGLFVLVLLPSSAYAQAAIAGVVRDASGGVLPGVTVEAASPALIEKVRTAVSDGSGQYRIEDLRPGTYTRALHADGLQHRVARGHRAHRLGHATISIDMRVGAVEETITVTGESPVVDVQTARRQTVLTNEIINAIPSAGSYNSLLVLVPGVVRRPAGRGLRSVQLVHVQRARHAPLGRPCQHRGAPAGGRHQHRRAAGRRHQLPHRSAQLAGGQLHHLGQPR